MKKTLVDDADRIAVVIPSYRVRKHILDVIGGIGREIWRIYVIDDKCPEETGRLVEEECRDRRVRVLRHEHNQGVGGAVMTGYRAAQVEGARIMVKIDGDGQMDPGLIPFFVEPILSGEADYTKGNRFFDLQEIRAMPAVRLFGNAVLSLMNKLSSGYWHLFDPTNGYTAIHADIVDLLPLDSISRRYFFETDMLFRLNTLRAVVIDVPMNAKYGGEESNLRIGSIVGEFLAKHARNFMKRIFYNYFLRDVSLASVELVLGMLMMLFGCAFGGYHWFVSAQKGLPTPAGTVMLAAMPMLMGLQFILSFIGYDIASVPTRPRHRRHSRRLTQNEEHRGVTDKDSGDAGTPR